MFEKRTVLDLAPLAAARRAAATDGSPAPVARLPSMWNGARTTKIVDVGNQGESSPTTLCGQ